MDRRPGFQRLLEDCLLSWLIDGRGVSQRTVEPYRDAFVLLLRWFDDEKGIRADSMTMEGLTVENIESFLICLSQVCGNAPKTANCRLAAIRSFCRYVSCKDPSRLGEMARILSIPQRKGTRADLFCLEPKEAKWLLGACDKNTPLGRETRLLIRVLYNPGARISETLALRVSDITLERSGSCRVLPLGKGRKERTLPMRPETAVALKAHIEENGISNGGYLFRGRNVEHLTRSGARSRIDAAVMRAAEKHASMRNKKATPHTFRHSTAVAMLTSGIDISTIAIWLGHEHIQTTHRYMVANMEMKENALSKVCPSWGRSGNNRYKAGPKTLRFLMSL